MTKAWKFFLNLGFALFLAGTATWLAISDFRVSGEILFRDSMPALVAALGVGLWFLLAHFLAVFPKRFLFPVIVLLAVRLALGFPLNLLLSNQLACLLVSTALAAIGAAYLIATLLGYRRLGFRDWFAWRHSVSVFVTGLLVSILSVPLGLVGLVTATQNVLGDYTQFSLTSISLLERVFQRGETRVHLIGMMHLGEDEFYREIDQRIAGSGAGRRVVLKEGVTDREGILPESFTSGRTYASLAARFGLKAQDSGRRKSDRPPGPGEGPSWSGTGVEAIEADIDVAELSPQHQEHLVAVLEALGSENLSDLLRGPEGVSDAELEDLMMEGLLRFRNDHLMEVFREVLADGAEEIYIPWGAAHLTDIESRLIAMGFAKIHEEKRPVVRFWK